MDVNLTRGTSTEALFSQKALSMLQWNMSITVSHRCPAVTTQTSGHFEAVANP